MVVLLTDIKKPQLKEALAKEYDLRLTLKEILAIQMMIRHTTSQDRAEHIGTVTFFNKETTAAIVYGVENVEILSYNQWSGLSEKIMYNEEIEHMIVRLEDGPVEED